LKHALNFTRPGVRRATFLSPGSVSEICVALSRFKPMGDSPPKVFGAETPVPGGGANGHARVHTISSAQKGLGLGPKIGVESALTMLISVSCGCGTTLYGFASITGIVD
jgi:hypothetical protein